MMKMAQWYQVNTIYKRLKYMRGNVNSACGILKMRNVFYGVIKYNRVYTTVVKSTRQKIKVGL